MRRALLGGMLTGLAIALAIIGYWRWQAGIASIRVTQIAKLDAVGDSTMMCGTYTRRDGVVGLLDPAIVLHYARPDSIYADEVLLNDRYEALCILGLARHGIALTTLTYRHTDWSLVGKVNPLIRVRKRLEQRT